VATFTDKLRDFAQKPIGYALFIALIVVLVAASLFVLGYVFGTIVMILVAFGLPVYLGWKKSFKIMFIVVIVVILAVPPIYTAFYNNELFTQYSVPNSSDSVLQHASVNPFSYPPAKGNAYDFSVAAVSQNISGNMTNTTRIILWVTDCPNDGAGSTDLCGENPDFFHSYSYTTEANNSLNHTRSENWAYWNITLPSDKVFYFQFTANSTLGHGYYYSVIGNCGFSHGVCQPLAQEGDYWNEGPITGSWGAIYLTVLPDSYLLLAVLGCLLAIVVLIYRYLKLREKRRQEEAKVAASGEPSPQETRCPNCGAIMKKDETVCWKCGKPPSSPSTDQPLK
jgi:hypothetical protein